MVPWRITIRLGAALYCVLVVASGLPSFGQTPDFAATISELEDSVRRRPDSAEGWYDLGLLRETGKGIR